MIAEKVSEWLTLDQVADQLGLSTGKIRRLIEEHVLFAVKIDKEPKVPAHLIVAGEPLSSIRGTLLMLLDLGLDIHEAIDWLYTENDDLGEMPIDALLKGHKAPVRRAAQTLG